VRTSEGDASMVNFDETYDKSIKAVHNLVEDIRFRRELNLDPIIGCSNQICQHLHTNINFFSILNSIKDKNPYMFSHPVNVAVVSFVIGKWMHLNNSELSQLVCAGLLHDIGKAKIKDRLLNKSEKLTAEEMEMLKTHPALGYSLLEGLNVLEKEVLLGVLFHHERNDGSGYPKGLKGEQINLFSRIIAIADIYDAMTSTRPYKIKNSPFKVVEEIEASSFDSLDPQICQVFLKNISNYYPGSVVRLSNELVGEIIYINQGERTRPLIHCGKEYLNLTEERDIEIVEVLQNVSMDM
jgi:HD-GYP domain-containing protein (c-di-GMP phosphodiesterase class II)